MLVDPRADLPGRLRPAAAHLADPAAPAPPPAGRHLAARGCESRWSCCCSSRWSIRWVGPSSGTVLGRKGMAAHLLGPTALGLCLLARVRDLLPAARCAGPVRSRRRCGILSPVTSGRSGGTVQQLRAPRHGDARGRGVLGAGVVPALTAAPAGAAPPAPAPCVGAVLGAAREHQLADPAAGQDQDDVRRAALRPRPLRHSDRDDRHAPRGGPQGRLLLQCRIVRELALRRGSVPGRGEGRIATAGPASSGSTSAASTCSCRSWKSRLDLCQQRGFDTVDPDNMDGYTNATGFPLTAADQLAYNASIANAAHARGLTVALKNDLDQIPQLVELLRLGAQRAVLRSTRSAGCSRRSAPPARRS